MEIEEIQRAREIIDRVRPDPWWGPDADVYARVGDLRELIHFLERALEHIGSSSSSFSCKQGLGEDWG